MLECGSIKADVKNCSPVSACATLLNAMQSTHILSLSVTHTDIHSYMKYTTIWRVLKKFTDLHNEAEIVHRAIGCVQTQECHGNTEHTVPEHWNSTKRLRDWTRL